MLKKLRIGKYKKSSERTVEHYETVLKYDNLVGCAKPSPRLQPTRESKFASCLSNVPLKQPLNRTY